MRELWRSAYPVHEVLAEEESKRVKDEFAACAVVLFIFLVICSSFSVETDKKK